MLAPESLKEKKSKKDKSSSRGEDSHHEVTESDAVVSSVIGGRGSSGDHLHSAESDGKQAKSESRKRRHGDSSAITPESVGSEYVDAKPGKGFAASSAVMASSSVDDSKSKDFAKASSSDRSLTPVDTDEEEKIDGLSKSKRRRRDDDPESVDSVNKPLSDFPLSRETVDSLTKRGILTLFPIQSMSFHAARSGKDLIGRAHTGMGKTLAFALPIIEQLLSTHSSPKYGRTPKVVVLAPTRELAKQVCEDFVSVASKFTCLCVYGGTPIVPQKSMLMRGVDILVGTPGRVIDLREQGVLKMDSVKHVVLDEADHMLDMGFSEDVQNILDSIPSLAAKPKTAQTMLFSATMPAWVGEVARKYMNRDVVTIDLVSDSSHKASSDVTHLSLQCLASGPGRSQIVSDLVQAYGGKDGRVIIFTDTKKEADEFVHDSNIKFRCEALHGDIVQTKRESVLAAFREGRIKCLVATDVAARGLDIKGVDLVIQLRPPCGNFSGRADVETYVHRSGRTGRAGRTGTCITLFSRSQEMVLKDIESKTGNVFTRIGAPQAADIAKTSAQEFAKKMMGLDESVLAVFKSTAEDILKDRDPVTALSSALAVMTGHTTSISNRSLLSASPGYTTCLFTVADIEIRTPSFIWSRLRTAGMNETIISNVRGMALLADSHGAVFDVAESDFKEFQDIVKSRRLPITLPTVLPAVFERPAASMGHGGMGGGRGRGRGFSGGRSFMAFRGRTFGVHS